MIAPLSDAMLTSLQLQDTVAAPTPPEGKTLVAILLATRQMERPWLLQFYPPVLANGGDTTVDRRYDPLRNFVPPLVPTNGPRVRDAIVQMTVDGDAFTMDYPSRGALYQVTATNIQVAVYDPTNSANSAKYTVSAQQGSDARIAPPLLAHPHRTIDLGTIPPTETRYTAIPRRAVAAYVAYLNDSVVTNPNASLNLYDGDGAQIVQVLQGTTSRSNIDVSHPVALPAGAVYLGMTNFAADDCTPSVVFLLSL